MGFEAYVCGQVSWRRLPLDWRGLGQNTRTEIRNCNKKYGFQRSIHQMQYAHASMDIHPRSLSLSLSLSPRIHPPFATHTYIHTYIHTIHTRSLSLSLSPALPVSQAQPEWGLGTLVSLRAKSGGWCPTSISFSACPCRDRLPKRLILNHKHIYI